MTELPERLQSALGGAYRLERELGGGGMSRVFLAEEIALGRKVVVKVLPPEMAAEVNADRFRREIQLAATLQHPHIVPLLTAGSADDLLYYVMPYVAGESLRQRLTREVELPVGETVRILREVLDALAEAHARGVVHRDIKPDNVLLSGRHAQVTDFGVAKAVSEAAHGSNLTSLGVALGTPAYMAPEQAAADPHVDHRADIYAVGALAYEMLCGRPPFVAPTAQAVLAAHLIQTPEPCTTYRPSVPPDLSALVGRCLEKKAADRPQSVEEVLAVLETLATPSGAMTPTDPVTISSGTRAAIERNHPVRVLLLASVGALAVLAVVYAMVRLVGLPAWVAPAAVAILVAGVPYLVITGRQERRRLLGKSSPGVQTTPPGLQRQFTWKRASLAGSLAFGILAVLTGGYLAMRQLGIGPVGTLIAKGALSGTDLIVMADFEDRTPEAGDSRTIQEALRIDLEQSPVVRLITRERVAEALARMGREAGTPLTADVAGELAQREGAKAVLTGEIAPLGSGYVVSVRLTNAATGEVLEARRETASGSDELIGAVERLSRGLRERIGESLRGVQGGQPLEQVTTSSFEALRRYAQGSEALNAGDMALAVELLREAIDLDPEFAMAYRKLGMRLNSDAGPRDQVVAALTKAFELRARLTERERLLTEAGYYTVVLEDRGQAIGVYQALLDRYPDDGTALNNLAILYWELRRYSEAEAALTRFIELPRGASIPARTNLLLSLLADGKLDEAEAALGHWSDASPGHPLLPNFSAQLALLRGDYDGAEAIIREAEPGWRSRSALDRWAAESWLRYFALLKGRIREARRIAPAERAADREAGADRLPATLRDPLDAARMAVWYGQGPAAALEALDSALSRYRTDSLAPSDRGYPDLVEVFALGGNAQRAREFLERYEREVTDVGPRTRAQAMRFMLGQVALAERRWPEAIAELRAWEPEGTPVDLIWVADAYDQAAQADSAIALYERWLVTPGYASPDAWWLPRTLRRLGELHEARGDGLKASEYYRRFAELWANADPEFQPMVREARAKAERLGSG